MRRFSVLALAFSSLGLAACSSGSGSGMLALEDEKTEMRAALARKIGTTPNEVKQALDTTPQNQRQVALAVTERVKQRYGTSDDASMRRHLQGVVDKLGRGVNADPESFKLIILASNQANAFTPGAGIIMVNVGLLQIARNEAEVAAVIAHEMAHVLMKHPQRQKQIRLASKAGGAVMDEFTPAQLENNIGWFLRLGGNVTMNGMIRQQEMMADSVAIDMLVKAGYDPRAMVDVLQTLRGRGTQMDRATNVVYGNHPLTADREAAAVKKIETRYQSISGVRSSDRFDQLVKPYHRMRNKKLAQRN